MRVVLQLQTVPTSHAACRDARIQTPTTGFPPLFYAEDSFPCSSLWYTILLLALYSRSATFCNMPIELTSTDGRTEDSQLDSLAASGRADAIPVSGSLTPPFRRQVAPQIQPEESQASVEEAHENVVETHIANKSIIEALKECVPKGSTSVLERLIHGRRQRAEAQLLGDGGSRVPGTWTPAAVWEHIGKMKPSDQRVFVIDDIDDEWCEALCTRYPHAINRKFLLEHILGLESARRAKDIHDSLSLELQPELSEVVDLDTLDRAFPCLMDAHEERFGEHIDCWLETEPPEARIYIYEGCKLRLDTSGWTKINCFVSYCRLEENFCKPDVQ